MKFSVISGGKDKGDRPCDFKDCKHDCYVARSGSSTIYYRFCCAGCYFGWQEDYKTQCCLAGVTPKEYAA